MKKIRELFVLENLIDWKLTTYLIWHLSTYPSTPLCTNRRWEPAINVVRCHDILAKFWKDVGAVPKDRAVGTVFWATQKFIGMLLTPQQ